MMNILSVMYVKNIIGLSIIMVGKLIMSIARRIRCAFTHHYFIEPMNNEYCEVCSRCGKEYCPWDSIGAL